MVKILFLSAMIMLFLGVPISVTIGASSLMYILLTDMEPLIIIQRLFAGINVAALLAIPFFVLAGDLMNSGGIAKRLVKLANVFVGSYTGGLSMMTVIACMFFAAMSGSGVATAAAMGAIMIPEMVKSGYDKTFASAVVAASSPIGVIIPPSISFILYGIITQSSIADLYLAGIPAGIMMGIVLMVTSKLYCTKKGYKGTYKKTTMKEKIMAVKEATWALGTPIILVGGVFGGIFTPTESAVVAVVYAIIVGVVIYKDIKVKDLPSIFFTSAKTTSKVMFIIANATLFAYILAYERIPQMIVDSFFSISSSKVVLLLIINGILLLAGTFMETTAIMIILVPLLWSVAQQIGVNVVHFGILVTVNTAIGLSTPPFGVCLFTTSSIGGTPLEKLSKEVFLFLFGMILVLLFITFVPQSILFLL